MRGYDILLGKQRLICYLDPLFVRLLGSVLEIPLVAVEWISTPIGSRQMINSAVMKKICSFIDHFMLYTCASPAIYPTVDIFAVCCKKIIW